MDTRALSVTLDGFHAQLFTLTFESFIVSGILSSRLARHAAQQAVELFVNSYQYDARMGRVRCACPPLTRPRTRPRAPH